MINTIKKLIENLPEDLQALAGYSLTEENTYKKGIFVYELFQVSKKIDIDVSIYDIAKFYNISKTGFLRVLHIIELGTEDQKARALSGQQGNSISTIDNEIRLQHPDKFQARKAVKVIKTQKTATKTKESKETKTCTTCGKDQPIEEFYITGGYRRNVCRTCTNQNYKKENRSIKKSIRNISNDDIIGNLYSAGDGVTYTINDLLEEISNFNNSFIRGISDCINDHKDLLIKPVNKSKIENALKQSIVQTRKIMEEI